MRNYLQDLCEGIDAAVFSGDVLFSDEERKELTEYVDRWKTAIVEHGAAEAAQPVDAAYPCWSCNKPVTIGQNGEADGNCPHCHAELDEDDWPADVTDRSVKLLKDFAIKFGKEDADEGLLEFYARKHYEQGVADATPQPSSAQPVAVPDEWRDAIEQAAEALEDNYCLESAHQLRAMLSAAQKPEGV